MLKQQTDGRPELPHTLRLTFRLPTEPLQDALFGAGPQVVSTVADHRPHQIARQPVLGAVYRGACVGPEAGDAVGGAQPDVSGVVLLDGMDAVARQPFPRGAHGHTMLSEAVDAAAGSAHPQAAFGIFIQASNHLIGEPIAGLIGTELPPGQPGHAGAVGADPQRPVAVRDQRHDAGWRVTVVLAICPEASLAILAHPPGAGADPQRAARAHRQSLDRVVRQPVLSGEYSFHAAFEAVQPVVGAHPDGHRRILQQGVHVGFRAAGEDGGGPAPIQPGQAFVGAHPQDAPRIHQQRADTGAGQARACNPLKGAMAVTQQPDVRGADPQRSIR